MVGGGRGGGVEMWQGRLSGGGGGEKKEEEERQSASIW